MQPYVKPYDMLCMAIYMMFIILTLNCFSMLFVFSTQPGIVCFSFFLMLLLK